MLFELNIQLFGGGGGGSGRDEGRGGYGDAVGDLDNRDSWGDDDRVGMGGSSPSDRDRKEREKQQQAEREQIERDKNPANFTGSFSDALADINASLDQVAEGATQGLTGSGQFSEKFNEKFGEINDYDSFVERSTEMGFDTLDKDALSKMTSGEAQDYIDTRATEMAQRFSAIEKQTQFQMAMGLEDMQRKALQRVTEQYDPATASLQERMDYNASVKGLQAVGMGEALQVDQRVGDYAKVAMGALSALSGNPMGIASMAYNINMQSQVNLTSMGQLAQHGKFTDPAMKGLQYSDDTLNKLGKQYKDIEDFASEVKTAEENDKLSEMMENFGKNKRDYENLYDAKAENVERAEEAKEVIEEGVKDTDQSQGGTGVTTGKAGFGFKKDVSNKGLGDVISVFDQITTEDEEEMERRKNNARARLGLAGLWG